MGVEQAGFEEGVRPLLFDIQDYEAMDAAGLFERVAGRVQLLEGRLIHMAPATAAHGLVTVNMLRAISAAAPEWTLVTQATLLIGRQSAPDPDLFVARGAPSGRYYAPGDVVLVFESALTTLETDLNQKRRLYAAAGIAEYWVADVDGRRLHVFRSPDPDGTYADEQVFEADSEVSPLFAPEAVIALKDVF